MRQRRVNITKILLGCLLLLHLGLGCAPVITVCPLDPPLLSPGAPPGLWGPVPLAAVLQELLDGGGVPQGPALANIGSGARS